LLDAGPPLDELVGINSPFGTTLCCIVRCSSLRWRIPIDREDADIDLLIAAAAWTKSSSSIAEAEGTL
jgi:hypothetical protein